MAELTNDGVILIAQKGDIEFVRCGDVYFKIETISDGHAVVEILSSKDAGKQIDFIRLSNSG